MNILRLLECRDKKITTIYRCRMLNQYVDKLRREATAHQNGSYDGQACGYGGQTGRYGGLGGGYGILGGGYGILGGGYGRLG